MLPPAHDYDGCGGLPSAATRNATGPHDRAADLEPQQPQPASQATKATNAAPIRLLDTQARGHIGRSVLHQQPNGELTEDSVWRWSSAPDRYLDTALRLEVASSPDMRLVDTGRAPAVAATLLVWDLESAGSTRLVGAAEFQITGLTVPYVRRWCEIASPFQRSYLGIWHRPRVGCCAA